MQDLIADMDKEIAAVKQQAIALRQRMIQIEALQTKASLDPILQEQLAHLKRSFDRAKKTLSEMEARKKNLIERMSKAITKPVSGLADLEELTTCIPLRPFRMSPQPLDILHQETLDPELEALKALLDQL